MSDSQEQTPEGVHGLVSGPCRHCREMIPTDTLACPACGQERLFDQHQYNLLKRCSDTKDVSGWNEWRRSNRNPDEHDLTPNVFLEGADLSEANLRQANLSMAHLEGARLHRAHLEGASLMASQLERADFGEAHLERADLTATLSAYANFTFAHLEGAHLGQADLKGAHVVGIHLEDAQCHAVNLEGVFLSHAHLEGACLWHAHLEGAHLHVAHLEGMTAEGAFVDAATRMWYCTFDKETDFSGVALASANLHPGFKALLERNIREINWNNWYEQSWLRKWILSFAVRLFWWISDYGGSTLRIALVFSMAVIVFSALYFACPGLVAELSDSTPSWHWQLARSVYFSIVTMTTLGLGDMYASTTHPLGYLALSLHVTAGYILLAALITRFAIMFQGTTVPYTRVPRRPPD